MASQTAESAFAGPCNLLGKSPEELRAFLESLGEPAYRGAQIYHALYAERRFDFEGMTNLPAKLRERLSRGAVIDLPRVLRKHCSDDGTIRYVLALDAAAQDSAAKDSEKTARSLTPATIETVFMPEENRQTICVSTQAGCAVDCQLFHHYLFHGVHLQRAQRTIPNISLYLSAFRAVDKNREYARAIIKI